MPRDRGESGPTARAASARPGRRTYERILAVRIPAPYSADGSRWRGTIFGDPRCPLLAPGEGERRATYFELFFDLIYVFAITQLSHHLLLDLSWTGAAETLFLLLAVYWAWNYTTWMTNWFDPETVAVRLTLIFVMLASLLMAVAIPEGFGERAPLFAASYCALQVVRNGFVVAVTPPGPFHRNFLQILVWSVLSVPVWILGAATEGEARWILWLTGLGLDLAAPLVRYWLPGYGRTPMSEWQIDPGHFSERFQLFVIIVLGESIVITGSTASGVDLDTAVVAALGFAFLSSVGLWWLYFGSLTTTAVRRIAADQIPGQLGRDAYTYLHIPIVAGVLLTAVGDELVIAHPGDELTMAGALVALGGPALFIAGLMAFGARVGRHRAWTRGAAAVALAACVPLAAEAHGLLVAAAATALLTALVVTDLLRTGTFTSWVRALPALTPRQWPTRRRATQRRGSTEPTDASPRNRPRSFRGCALERWTTSIPLVVSWPRRSVPSARLGISGGELGDMNHTPSAPLTPSASPSPSSRVVIGPHLSPTRPPSMLMMFPRSGTVRVSRRLVDVRSPGVVGMRRCAAVRWGRSRSACEHLRRDEVEAACSGPCFLSCPS